MSKQPKQDRRHNCGGDQASLVKGEKSGKQAFSELQRKAFESVLAYASEIHVAIENRVPMHTRAYKVGKVDFWITVQRVVEQTLNKGLLKNWNKAMRGEEIGSGSRNMLIAKLAKAFMSKEFALWPRARFFTSSAAWSEKAARDRQMKIIMTPKQLERAAIAVEETGVRRYGEEGCPLVVCREPFVQEPELQQTEEEYFSNMSNYDFAFERQGLESNPMTEANVE